MVLAHREVALTQGQIGLHETTVRRFKAIILGEYLLAQGNGCLAGLYAGNPKRATARPTAERILGAFEHITLTVIREPPRTLRHITPLSSLQQRILDLLDLSSDIYTWLCTESSKPA